MVAGREDVQVAVVVVIEGPARKAALRTGYAHFGSNVGERAVAIVVEQLRSRVGISREEVGIAVVVIVDPSGPFADLLFALDAGLGGDLLEGAVAPISVQAVRAGLATDEEVEKTVVVEIGPGGAD